MTAAVVGLLLAAAASHPAATARQATAAPASETQPSRKPFVPARDGRLMADQIKMYIAVRRLALRLAASEAPSDVVSQIGQLAAGLSGEAEASAQLGADIDEYRWVSARIAEARPRSGATGDDEVVNAIAAAARQSRAAIAAVANASEPPDAINASDPGAAARVFNRQLLERYRSDLDALNRPSRR
jgi:hypothetical protein